jgi:Polyketide cyclase / dehydrase and lipid transport
MPHHFPDARSLAVLDHAFMASIRREISIETSLDEAWDALRDWGALHERLARGFAIDTRVEGRDRIVTFFNGTVLRERIVTVDDKARLLVWSIGDGPYEHHNGSAQVFAEHGRVTLAWISDLLPDELSERTAEMMELGLKAMKETLERTHEDATDQPRVTV